MMVKVFRPANARTPVRLYDVPEMQEWHNRREILRGSVVA